MSTQDFETLRHLDILKSQVNRIEGKIDSLIEATRENTKKIEKILEDLRRK